MCQNAATGEKWRLHRVSRVGVDLRDEEGAAGIAVADEVALVDDQLSLFSDRVLDLVLDECRLLLGDLRVEGWDRAEAAGEMSKESRKESHCSCTCSCTHHFVHLLLRSWASAVHDL